MQLKILDAVTEPGAVVNEDRWGTNGEATWVMDGATGVWPEQRLSKGSDAAWFVEQCDDTLTRLFRGDRDPRDILAEVASAVATSARGLYAIDDAAPFTLPSASFVAARIVADRLQLTNLGDCITLWRSGVGPARRFGTSGVTVLDERLSARVQALLANGLSIEQARPQIMDMARQHRKLMNQPGGYWILDFSGRGASHAEVETVAEEGPLQLLLMSDGFSRLVEIYGRHDFDGLLIGACSRGLGALFEELRQIEADDEGCTAFPRNKVRDDATAVLIEVG